MPLTPGEARSIGRMGGLSTLIKTGSGSAMTQPARRAFMDQFYDGLEDKEPEERERIAQARRKLHMTKLSHRAARARKLKAVARAKERAAAAAAEAEQLAAETPDEVLEEAAQDAVALGY